MSCLMSEAPYEPFYDPFYTEKLGIMPSQE